MEKIIIKKAETIEECKECDKLLESLIKYESGFDEQINKEAKIEGLYQRTLTKDDSVIFVALNENIIVGYIMAYKKEKNDACNNDIITIMNVFIDEKFRNKKIGLKFMKEVESWAKLKSESFDIELDCISNNINANAFYKKLGFEPVRIKYRKSFRK